MLVKTLTLSLDPAMRGWMNEGKSYIPPVGIDEVMRAGGIGVVVASETPGFAVGDHVSGAARRAGVRARSTRASSARGELARSTSRSARRRSG